MASLVTPFTLELISDSPSGKKKKKKKSDLLLAVNVNFFVSLEETSSSRHHTASSSTREAEYNKMTSKESQTEASQTQEVTI